MARVGPAGAPPPDAERDERWTNLEAPIPVSVEPAVVAAQEGQRYQATDPSAAEEKPRSPTNYSSRGTSRSSSTTHAPESPRTPSRGRRAEGKDAEDEAKSRPPPGSPGLSPSELAEYLSLFETLDEDSSGTVSREELIVFFSETGTKMSAAEVDNLVGGVGGADGEEITFDQFVAALHQASSRQRKRRPSVELGANAMVALWTVDPRPVWRRDLWELLEDPLSSRTATLVGSVIMLAVLLSCAAFIIQTLRQFQSSDDPAWDLIEYLCIVLFSLEYVLRLAAADDRRSFVKAPLNIVDLLAVLPFYVELIFSGEGTATGSALLRAVRLIRVFRVLKISRYLTWANVFLEAFKNSMAPLSMCLFVFVLAMVFASSAMFYAEKDAWHYDVQGVYSPSAYTSIPQCFWWAVITMCTVGYGDMVPVTTGGKLIAGVTSVSGILILAVPISVISANFQTEYDKMLRRAELKTFHKEHAASTNALMSAEFQQEYDRVRSSIKELPPIVPKEGRRRSVDRSLLMASLDDVGNRFQQSFHLCLTDAERGSRDRLLQRFSSFMPFRLDELGLTNYGSLPFAPRSS